MRISTLTLPLSTGLLLALTSCGSTTTPPTAVATPPPATIPANAPAAATGTTARPPAPAVDAAAVTKKLTAAGLPVKLTVVYDATSDPNGKLGKPRQYISKTAFDDTRVSGLDKATADATKGRRDSLVYGGTVEVFATAEDAQGWAEYIDKSQQAMGTLMIPDHILRKGPVVVRLSHLLTAEQARAYEALL
ncbi:hypothetical protein ACWEQL_34630 [Kitasatospora sp. NPDC004240]